ncbi:MAG: isoaspartyl peptidase, partial [Clostridia bacterium]|nr:isoaspartyl peptidase [Clostridia bacterium]
ELINEILNLTDIRAKTYSSRWIKIWNTSSMQKYRRAEHEDVWLWNHDFYNASIEELEKIYTLIK